MVCSAACIGAAWASCCWRYPVRTLALRSRHTLKPSWLQAGDLRRLLALYQGWHRRVFPFTTFDGFLEDLEKLGATAAFKACRRGIWLPSGFGIRPRTCDHIVQMGALPVLAWSLPVVP